MPSFFNVTGSAAPQKRQHWFDRRKRPRKYLSHFRCRILTIAVILHSEKSIIRDGAVYGPPIVGAQSHLAVEKVNIVVGIFFVFVHI